ncbi:MAG: extracellular solute-binding protein [Hyphomicrobiales bacterium]
MKKLLFACGLALGFAVSPVWAEPKHGLSAFGDLKYGPDFTHFDYVNPDAPKGGKISMIGTAALRTFNSFNAFILKGDAAQGLGFLFDTLMARASDEPDAVYGLVSETAEVADDDKSVTFYLRKEAKFADGTPVTAEDIVFSFNTIKEKGHPAIALSLALVEKVEALDDHTVKFSFSEPSRDMPLTVATGIPVLSKAYYTENDFSKTTLTPPLGSGPYEIADHKQGRYVTYKLRDDYWGKDLPVNRGQYNFGEMRYEYFRDRTAEFEGLKAGVFDLREEFTSRDWATKYTFRAVEDGRVLTETLPDERPSGAQGFFINMRRDKFKDARVRQALALAFDFEWTNKNLFFGLYKRTGSFFENSAMRASGKLSAEELALLEPFRDQLPAEVFEEAYEPPKSNASGQDRKLLRQASKLLKEAGWSVKDGKRVNNKGEALDVSFLIFSPTMERIIAPYVKSLKQLGIDARIRIVDPAQYQNRLKAFDFDITTARFVVRQTPGAELDTYFSSKAAELSGSQNLSGISDPVIDALIDKAQAATSRDELNTAMRALDRVLRAQHFWVPHWYKASHTIAYWNKFSRPETKPKFDRGIITTWWYDDDKAAKLNAN